MPSKQYFAPETSTVFKSSGGDITFTPTSVATAAGRVSAQWDRGSGSKPGLYRWFAKTKNSADATVGLQLAIFLAQANDSTNIPGRLGTSDAGVSSSNSVRNLGAPVGSIIVDSTNSDTDALIASGVCFIYARFVSLVWWNETGQALSGTAGDHEFILTPIPPENQ